MKKFLLAAMVAVTGTVAAQVDESADDQPRSMSQAPTMTFAGDRYRLGVGVDTEFDVIGEFMATLTEDPDSALIGEGWLGRKSAGGIKLNYHWLFSGESEMGPDGKVYTDGRIAKLFVAADQNQHDDRKLTLGAGYERKDWFISLYGMRALTDERLVNRAVNLSDVLVRGELDGRGFTRIDMLERVTDLFEKPFDWGVGLRAGKYYDDRLLRLRGGFDYEKGDFGNSQMTASFTADRFFAGTPHGLSLRTGWAIKRGDLVDDPDQGGLPGPVRTQQSEYTAFRYIDGNPVQGPVTLEVLDHIGSLENAHGHLIYSKKFFIRLKNPFSFFPGWGVKLSESDIFSIIFFSSGLIFFGIHTLMDTSRSPFP